MLSICNLTANIGDSDIEIIKGVNLDVKAGEIHAIMGPNGSGKSTIGKILAGHPSYKVTGGKALFDGLDLLTLTTDERAKAGIFLGFQHPIEVPGVNNASFLRLAYNKKLAAAGQEELDPLEFNDFIAEKIKLVNMSETFLDRNLNEGFSGGEKKRNEILQMCLLEPKLAILDELDSGLDIDTVRILGELVKKLMQPTNAIIIITHFPRILEIIKPDKVHVLYNGRIVKTGDINLAFKLDDQGYDWLKSELNPITIL